MYKPVGRTDQKFIATGDVTNYVQISVLSLLVLRVHGSKDSLLINKIAKLTRSAKCSTEWRIRFIYFIHMFKVFNIF